MKTVWEQIDECQQWLRENQVKASDEAYDVKLKELRDLMDNGYITQPVRTSTNDIEMPI